MQKFLLSKPLVPITCLLSHSGSARSVGARVGSVVAIIFSYGPTMYKGNRQDQIHSNYPIPGYLPAPSVSSMSLSNFTSLRGSTTWPQHEWLST